MSTNQLKLKIINAMSDLNIVKPKGLAGKLMAKSGINYSVKNELLISSGESSKLNRSVPVLRKISKVNLVKKVMESERFSRATKLSDRKETLRKISSRKLAYYIEKRPMSSIIGKNINSYI